MKIWMASHLRIIRTRPASSNPYTLCHPKRYGQRAFLSAPAAAWYWLLRPSQNPAPWERWSLETMKGSTSPQKLSAEFLALPQLQNKCVVKKTFRVPKSIWCIIGMHDIKSTTDHRFNHCYLSWKTKQNGISYSIRKSVQQIHNLITLLMIYDIAHDALCVNIQIYIYIRMGTYLCTCKYECVCKCVDIVRPSLYVVVCAHHQFDLRGWMKETWQVFVHAQHSFLITWIESRASIINLMQ